MSINFRKLKKQIKRTDDGLGYIFWATKEQDDRDIFSMRRDGSKTGFMKAMVSFIRNFDHYRAEFTL